MTRGRQRMITQVSAAAASLAGGSTRVRVPEAGRVLWQWFLDLHRARSFHGAGPNPINFGEIHAYAMLAGLPLRPEDVAAIRAVDDAWISASYQNRPERPIGVKQGAGSALNPAAFDAVFS